MELCSQLGLDVKSLSNPTGGRAGSGRRPSPPRPARGISMFISFVLHVTVSLPIGWLLLLSQVEIGG